MEEAKNKTYFGITIFENNLVKDEANIKIGELQFQNNKFFFVYDNNFVGFQFSDINVNLSRSFESESLFNIFAFDESWNKNELVKTHCLENKTENEIQWFILNLWAEKDELVQGFKYEKTRYEGTPSPL